MKKLLSIIFTLCVLQSFSQQVYYDVTAGNGNGVRFWQTDAYKIHMGNLPEYKYGPVTDYSIKMNMSGDNGRGWTWGVAGYTPVAAIGNQGNMQIAGTFTANNIGIGTTSPQTKLEVAGGKITVSYLNSEHTNGNSIPMIGSTFPGLVDYGAGINTLINNAGNNSYGLQFITREAYNISPSAKMTLGANGRLGIGTGSPGARLHVATSSDLDGILLNHNNQDWVEVFSPSMTTGAYNGITKAGDAGIIFGGSGLTNGFVLAPHQGAISGMRVDKNGNVGIGISTPLDKLHVSGGNIIVDKSLAFNNQGYFSEILKFQSGAYPNNTGFLFRTEMGGAAGASVKVDAMAINHVGNVGIGTTDPGSFKLAVNGKTWSTEVQVAVTRPPDYVFEPTYDLKPLAEIESYIKENKHLPEVPSAKEMEANGVQLGEMNMLLLKKVEELTLYVIEQQKENTKQADEIKELKKLIKK